jgi:hypothetical protein
MLVVLDVKVLHEDFAEQIAVDHRSSSFFTQHALDFMRARVQKCPGIGSTCRAVGACQSNIPYIMWQQWE